MREKWASAAGRRILANVARQAESPAARPSPLKRAAPRSENDGKGAGVAFPFGRQKLENAGGALVLGWVARRLRKNLNCLGPSLRAVAGAWGKAEYLLQHNLWRG